jgi:glutamate racemase
MERKHMRFETNSPIGILDSGVGGFSVARRVRSLLPGEDFLYLGDGAHFPYGNYDKDTIVALSRKMFRFLSQRRVKALLVACNTISCTLEELREEAQCPVLDVVQAGVDAAADLNLQRVGVISTVFTHASGCYQDRLRAKGGERPRIFSRGCRDLARLIEQGLDTPEGLARIEADLRRELDGLVQGENIQCCILGCTHYPLVEGSIRKLYPGLPLIDPAEEMAQTLRRDLLARGLLNPQTGLGTLDIYTTGDPEEYARRAEQAQLGPVRSVERVSI